MKITSFGEEFANKVKKRLPKEFNINDLVVLSSGLVLVPHSATEKQGYRPVGCPMCLDKSTSQDSDGYPCFNDKRLLTPEEAQYPIENVPPELITNLWLCPRCFLPVSSLLPQFDLSAL